MKIINLTEDSKKYTANVYMVLGEWNAIDDLTTLIDVGADASVVNKIEQINTGLGKKKIDQVVLTHTHSDHTAILPQIIEKFKPRVCAFNAHLKGVDYILRDGNMLRVGEENFEVFHISAHSYDSVCLYGKNSGVLFSGDTFFPILFENDVLKQENEFVLSRLKKKKITKVLPGHGGIIDYTEKEFNVLREYKI